MDKDKFNQKIKTLKKMKKEKEKKLKEQLEKERIQSFKNQIYAIVSNQKKNITNQEKNEKGFQIFLNDPKYSTELKDTLIKFVEERLDHYIDSKYDGRYNRDYVYLKTCHKCPINYINITSPGIYFGYTDKYRQKTDLERFIKKTITVYGIRSFYKYCQNIFEDTNVSFTFTPNSDKSSDFECGGIQLDVSH